MNINALHKNSGLECVPFFFVAAYGKKKVWVTLHFWVRHLKVQPMKCYVSIS